MAGVTPNGFESKTDETIASDLRAAFRRVFGAGVNVDPRSRVGQLLNIFAAALSEGWNTAASLATALDPSSSGGVLLDHLAALTGTVRRAATKSAVQLVVTGTGGTVLALGRRAGVPGTTTLFETTAGATLVAATAWAATTAYAAGDFVAASGSIWVCTVAGTSASTVPSGAGPFVDGTVTWELVGTGTAMALVDAEASVTGPLQGFARSITVIDTPVSGWASVTNLLDAVAGQNIESDDELRLRRAEEIASIGTSPLNSIRAELLRVEGVSSVTVFENTTDVTVDGITPHAIEALVEGGADAALRQAIFDSIAAGIESCGGVSGSVVDSAGNSHTIKFSRPAAVVVWVKVTLTKEPGVYPINGDAQVKAAIVAAGDLRGLGVDVVASRIAADVFKAVPGVIDVTQVLIGTSNPPVSSATIPISLRQRGAFDTSRVSVVTSNGVP